MTETLPLEDKDNRDVRGLPVTEQQTKLYACIDGPGKIPPLAVPWDQTSPTINVCDV